MIDNDGKDRIDEFNTPNIGDDNPQPGIFINEPNPVKEAIAEIKKKVSTIQAPQAGTFSKKLDNPAINAAIDEIKDKVTNIQYPQAGTFSKKPDNPAINASIKAIADKVGATMSNNQSLAHQLELLDDLKRHIQLLQSQMESMMQHYRTKVQNLHDAGMMIERHDRLQRQVFEPTNGIMTKFIQHLQERDLAVVEMVFQKVAADLADEQRGGR